MKTKIDIIWVIVIIFITFIMGVNYGVWWQSKDPKSIQCNHIKVNKDLIWMNSILQSDKPVVKILENGWCLTYEPCGYSKSIKLKNKIKNGKIQIN